MAENEQQKIDGQMLMMTIGIRGITDESAIVVKKNIEQAISDYPEARFDFRLMPMRQVPQGPQ